MDTLDMVQTINAEDATVAAAVAQVTPAIAQAVDGAAERYRKSGRLVYAGAGTSGRLGVLDASELVPTYGIKPERAVGLIAGGRSAMFSAVEGAEDNAQLGADDLLALKLTPDDVVIGIAASGRTPYVLGALDYANTVGALTIAVACVPDSAIGQKATIAINAVVGPEVVTGSTRMKAGTAQKLILNTLSTGVMIKVGKVYQNLMVDVLPTNQKLVDRAQRIVAATAEVDAATAQAAFKAAGERVPVAIVIAKTGSDAKTAAKLLADSDGSITQVFTKWNAEHDTNN
ncbi:N-acetylmuramic acid 6-phosphate etherase [Lacticaseibacillus songhuajiangensis]|uniref:N-acetylmuramic acid 6-phosphate etherase n=1 Tax=Lacticaseibacillus songhuajiangensis TaxID=1296539 RepID=UPI0021F06C86|nr:N-acetylmuramic acid 6-phosphate etherase [Lacticaseibacillus songhuajiangensis]